MRQIICFLQQRNVKIERKGKRGTHKSVGTVIDLKNIFVHVFGILTQINQL